MQHQLLSTKTAMSCPWMLVLGCASTPFARCFGDGVTLPRRTDVTRVFRSPSHNQPQVDVPNSELELLVWVRQSWKDPRLKWNPADYGGINQTSYHARMSDAMEDGDIWMPDLELYNTPGSLHALSNKPVMLRLVKHTCAHTDFSASSPASLDVVAPLYVLRGSVRRGAHS